MFGRVQAGAFHRGQTIFAGKDKSSQYTEHLQPYSPAELLVHQIGM